MSKKQLDWLSSVRGAAALMVIIRHIWPYFYAGRESVPFMTFLDLIITQVLDSGKIGVVIFFLISGFLLPKSMQRKTRREFLINRLIRLYPAYWVSIISAVIFVGGFTVTQVLVNLTMFQTFLFVPDVIGVYWTMPVEIVLYAGCIIFYKMLRDNNIRFINVLYILIGIACVGIAFLRNVTDLKLPVAMCTLIFTAFLGHYIRLFTDGDVKAKHLAAAVSYFFVMFVPTSVLAYNTDMGYGETWYRYVLSYAVGIAMFIIFNRTGANAKMFTWLGGISYSLYLMHRVVISCMCDNIMGGSCPIWYLFIVLAVIFAVSIPVNILVEGKLTKYLNKKFG